MALLPNAQDDCGISQYQGPCTWTEKVLVYEEPPRHTVYENSISYSA